MLCTTVLDLTVSIIYQGLICYALLCYISPSPYISGTDMSCTTVLYLTVSIIYQGLICYALLCYISPLHIYQGRICHALLCYISPSLYMSMVELSYTPVLYLTISIYVNGGSVIHSCVISHHLHICQWRICHTLLCYISPSPYMSMADMSCSTVLYLTISIYSMFGTVMHDCVISHCLHHMSMAALLCTTLCYLIISINVGQIYQS